MGTTLMMTGWKGFNVTEDGLGQRGTVEISLCFNSDDWYVDSLRWVIKRILKPDPTGTYFVL